ncbi:MAG: type VI secretion system-associated FHA domain protein TagH [Burkholderiales bacterium]
MPDAVATIGRDAACTVVLQDPDKFVSRRHASITQRDGVCHFTVTSSANTAIVNGRTLACGQSTPLSPGDQISIPPFELTLQLLQSAPEAMVPPATAAPPAADADPFRSVENFPPSAARTPETSDPFQLPPGLGGGNGGSGLLAGLDLPAAPVAMPESIVPPANLDPLAALDHASARSPRRTAPEKRFGVQGAPSIPAPVAPVPPTREAETRDAAESLAELLPNPLAGLDDLEEPAAIAAPEHVHAFNLPLTGAPAAPVPTPQPALRQPAPTLAGVPGSISALLDGLGLPHFQVPPEQQEEFLRFTGSIARAAIEGILAILASRSQLKKELGAENRTMLAQRNNNPLKVMNDPDEALRFLFDPGYRTSTAFLPPTQAIRDACDDIFAHEVALVAATRAAVVGAIRRFDPDRLEQSLEADKGGGLLSNKRARLWEAYVEHYRKLEQDMTDDVDAIFERDFLRAYMEQVKRLKR